MQFSHAFGLWTSTGTLLATTVVSPTSPLTGDFRYEPVSAVNLLPGVTYHLGAYYGATNTAADGYRTGTTARVFAPGISILNSLRDPDGAAADLAFPSATGAGTGRFGPNFLFVPAPGGALPLIAGLALAGRRRR